VDGLGAPGSASGVKVSQGDIVEVSEIIAGYAALVGTAAAAWPILQARRAKHPNVEVALFHTVIRNDAAEKEFSDGRLTYLFMPKRIDVLKQGAAFPHAGVTDDFSERIAQATPTSPPIPGIILARDAGSRMLPEEAVFSITAAAIQLRADGEAHQGLSDREVMSEVAIDFEGELIGWVRLSTGEYFSTRKEWKRQDSRLH
jgi:hypothetical protein